MAKAYKNGQSKTSTQTIHIAVSKDVVRRIEKLAVYNKRSMSAQAAWLLDQALREGSNA